MKVFPAVTRNRRRFIEHILKKYPDLDVVDRNYITARIMLSRHEGHYLEDMILINVMNPRVVLHEVMHHFFWKLCCPLIFHDLWDDLDIILRRRQE